MRLTFVICRHCARLFVYLLLLLLLRVTDYITTLQATPPVQHVEIPVVETVALGRVACRANDNDERPRSRATRCVTLDS